MPFTDAAGVLQRLQRLRRHGQGAGELRRVGHGHAANAGRSAAAGDRSSASRRRSHPTQTIHVATRGRCRGAERVTAQQPMNAWHFTATQRARHGVRRRATTTSGTPASVVVDDARAPSRERAGRVQRHRGRLSSHGALRAARARLALAQLAGRALSVREDDGRAGLAGMEYPMMANDESYPDTTFSRFVAEHEIAHTYFPFYMGINETRYAFMDEGWATTFEYLDRTARTWVRSRRTSSSSSSACRAGSSDPLADRGPADHHAGRRSGLGQQRLRQAGARLPRAQGPAGRRASSGRRCTRSWIAGTASIRSRGTSSTPSTT